MMTWFAIVGIPVGIIVIAFILYLVLKEEGD